MAKTRIQTRSPLAEQVASTSDAMEALSGRGQTAQPPSGMREVEITPEMRESTPVRRPGEGGKGNILQRVSSGIKKGAGAIRDAGKDITNVLATPEGQMFGGQLGAAFGQGDPTSPATILGEQVMQQAQQRADGRIMSRLLSGEDISDIPAEELGMASQEVQQRALDEKARKEEMAFSEENLQLQEDYRKRSLDLQESGQDLSRWKMENIDEVIAKHGIEEANRRLEIAEYNAETQRQTVESLTRLREAQIEDMGNDKSQSSVDKINMERRNLIQNYGNYIESEEERIRILQDELSVIESSQGERTRGAGSTVAETFRRFREGDFETPASEFRKVPATEEYLTLKGRVAEAQENIEEMRDQFKQLAQQQTQALAGGEQAPLPEPPPTEDTQPEETPDVQTIQDLSETADMLDGQVFEYQGKLYRIEGSNAVEVTEEIRG